MNILEDAHSLIDRLDENTRNSNFLIKLIGEYQAAYRVWRNRLDARIEVVKEKVIQSDQSEDYQSARLVLQELKTTGIPPDKLPDVFSIEKELDSSEHVSNIINSKIVEATALATLGEKGIQSAIRLMEFPELPEHLQNKVNNEQTDLNHAKAIFLEVNASVSENADKVNSLLATHAMNYDSDIIEPRETLEEASEYEKNLNNAINELKEINIIETNRTFSKAQQLLDIVDWYRESLELASKDSVTHQYANIVEGLDNSIMKGTTFLCSLREEIRDIAANIKKHNDFLDQERQNNQKMLEVYEEVQNKQFINRPNKGYWNKLRNNLRTILEYKHLAVDDQKVARIINFIDEKENEINRNFSIIAIPLGIILLIAGGWAAFRFLTGFILPTYYPTPTATSTSTQTPTWTRTPTITPTLTRTTTPTLKPMSAQITYHDGVGIYPVPGQYNLISHIDKGNTIEIFRFCLLSNGQNYWGLVQIPDSTRLGWIKMTDGTFDLLNADLSNNILPLSEEVKLYKQLLVDCPANKLTPVP